MVAFYINLRIITAYEKMLMLINDDTKLSCSKLSMTYILEIIMDIVMMHVVVVVVVF